MATANISITSDVRNNIPIVVQYGIRSNDITRRVATGGNMTFELDNSEFNSGSLIGYYSPDHANAASGFKIGNEITLTLTYSGSTFTKFVGNIDAIEPVGGKHRGQAVRVTVVDWMAQAGRYKVNADIPTQVDQTFDQVITTSLSSITEQPKSTSLSTGQETFTYSLDSGTAKQTTLLRELQKLAQSEMGYIYQVGDNASGGVLVGEDRHSRIKKTSACTSASINDIMTKIKISRDTKRIKNIIRTRVHPRNVESSASDVFTLDFTPEVFPSASTLILGEYKDPGTNRPIGGASVIVPIAGTDYTMHDKADGTGKDLTYDQKGRIISAATAPNNLAGYWMLADDAGTTSVKEETDIYTNKYGTACGLTFGGSGIGDGRTAASFDGADDYVDVSTACFHNAMDGSEGTLAAWVQVSASEIWTDATTREIFRARVDANNNIVMGRNTTNNNIRFLHQANNLTATVDDSTFSGCTNYFHAAMTWSISGSKIVGYVNGVQSGSTAASGPWSGTPASAYIGNQLAKSGSGWSGLIGHVALYNEVLAASDLLNMYNAASGGFNLDAEIGGFATEFNIKNQNEESGFITKLQIRGRRVKDFQPTLQEAKSASSQTNYGDLELLYDMPYLENPLVGKDAADWLLANLKDPLTDIDRIEFIANDSDAAMTAMLDTEPGDRVRLQETMSGIDTDFFVNGIQLKIMKTDLIKCTWYVTPVLDQSEKFWSLETTDHGELEQNTYLVF